MASPGDPTLCGAGTSPATIACVINSCQNNMTPQCVNRMIIDFSVYQPWLVSYCNLSLDSPQLALSLGVTCRDVCSRDRTSCRVRRQEFCRNDAVRASSDPRILELCACYQDNVTYNGLIERAIAQGSISGMNAAQLSAIRDILANAVNYPFCWSAACSTSEYGEDTEIATPCQNIALCVQSIDIDRIEGTGPISLTNNCALNASPVTQPVPVGIGATAPEPVTQVSWTATWWLLGFVIVLSIVIIVLLWSKRQIPAVVHVPVSISTLTSR